MSSSIDVGAAGNGNLSSPNRPMMGQAPWVVNAGLSWLSRNARSSATLLYNVVGRRISSAGLIPMPDVYEEARHVVDLSVRFPLLKAVEARLDAKNLLDAEYRFTQGGLLREGWRAGRVVSVGLAWRP
jgi:outer membrane receptor protein involved in Fe transport